jgi:hypothetical protein
MSSQLLLFCSCTHFYDNVLACTSILALMLAALTWLTRCASGCVLVV